MKTTFQATKTVSFVLWTVALVLALAASPSFGEQSAEEVANELANPNTALGFLAFQLDYITFDGDLPDAGDQHAWKLNFQPSLPYPIGEGVNFFLRPFFPVILDQPVPVSGGFEDKGVDLGDISFDAAVGKSFSSGLVLIGGMVGTLPTATNNDLGLNQWLLGPEAFVGWKFKWGFLGALFNHQWDIAGEDDYSTSITGGQYFYTINLKDAWQIQAQPTWSYNHEAESGSKWTFPLGIGVSKTIIIGKTPWKFSLQYWNYIAAPDAFGPEQQIRFQVAPVVPLPW
ncbi:MAG: hypothetical protein ACWGNK_07795 [Desulfobacterales bacterium]